jgi:hypothetical protein
MESTQRSPDSFDVDLSPLWSLAEKKNVVQTESGSEFCLPSATSPDLKYTITTPRYVL